MATAEFEKLEEFRLIVAVEEPELRAILIKALEPLYRPIEEITPEELLQSELSGDVMILLETSNEVRRLIDSAKKIYETWDRSGLASVQFLAYLTRDAAPDKVVFELWSIGPELKVLVQAYRPREMRQYAKEAAAFSRRWIQTIAKTSLEDRRAWRQKSAVTGSDHMKE